jgi:murein DD-endopeptidase MepM/ murein hydrolase activator NlpD
LQLLFGAIPNVTVDKWLTDVGENGFFATYSHLFGNAFAYTLEPLLPETLSQPALELPWPSGETWYLTGGPHGAWASGTAWAALDFAPPQDQLGCYSSDAWVTAMADGLVTRSDAGAVVTDLDEDGFAGTGWSITYMHVETRDRVPVGSFVQAGDPIGHPSCEGGYSNGTHLHVARAYNGRWISADGPTPFAMGGWTAQGLGREYDGLLVKGDQVKEACECREESNAILAD